MSFSEKEFKSSIMKCNNSLSSGLDKLFRRHLKVIINNSTCLKNFINIANLQINLGHWPLYFKMLSSIIIPKPNKTSYNSLKIFRPIFLLNTLGRLIKKVIGERLQFQSIFKNFIHPCQLDGLKQHSTIGVGVVLTHFICTEQVKNLSTSTLTFNIT